MAKIVTKQGNNEADINIWGEEHPDVFAKISAAIDGAGEQKVVGKTLKYKEPEKDVVKPIGTDTELTQTSLICSLENGKTQFVTGPFPVLKKQIAPIVNKIKSTCSIGGSRVVGVRRDTVAEQL